MHLGQNLKRAWLLSLGFHYICKNGVFMKKQMLTFLFSIWTAVFFLQPVSAKEFSRKTDYYTRFKRISTNEGLSSNMVLSILQDKQGVMWFGTMNGLTRYDGNTFVHYKNQTNNETSLSDNRITSLAEDTCGNIWIGTQNGLNCYNRQNNNFIQYYAKADDVRSLRSNWVKSLYADKDGYLWIETDGGFLSRIHIESGEWKHTSHAVSSKEGDYYFHPIYEDRHRNLWIGGRNIAPTYYKGKDMDQIGHILRNPDITYNEGRCYVETEDGDFLLGNYPNELAQYDPLTNKMEIVATLDLSPVAALRDKKGFIWLGGDPGLICMDMKQKVITHFKYNPSDVHSLISNKVYCLYKDRDECIWVGTDQGVCLYSEKLNAIRHYRRIEGVGYPMISNSVTALMQDNDGLIWVGTAEHGVDTMSLEHENFGNLTYSLLRHDIGQSVFDREKEVLRQYFRHRFIRGDGKIGEGILDNYSVFRAASLQFANVNENKVSSLYTDKEGIVYVGLWSHVGFNRYDKKEKTFKRYALWSKEPDRFYPRVFEGNPFGANWYAGFLEDDRSNFWCATWEAFGLNLFNRQTGQFEPKHYIPGDKPRNTYLKLSFDPVRQRMIMGGVFYYGYYDLKSASFLRYDSHIPDKYPNKDILEGYYRYCRVKQTDGMPPEYVLESYLLQSDVVWLGNVYSIVKHRLDTDTFETIHVNSGSWNIRFAESNDPQYIWVGTDSILRRINKENNQLETLVVPDNTTITSLYEDGTGQLWIGTEKSLHFWDIKAQKLLRDQVVPERIGPITGDKEEGVVYVTFSSGLSVWKNGEETDRFTFSDDLPGTSVTTLYLNRDKDVCVGTNGGLAIINPRSRTVLKYVHNPDDQYTIIDNMIQSVSEDDERNLWVATGKGLCMLKRGEIRFTDLSMPDDRTITSRLTSCIIQDKTGKIWIGTTENGISVLDPESDRMKHYIHQTWNKTSVSDNYIYCINEGPTAGLWVGTRRGLDKYLPERECFERIAELSGLQVMHIEEDCSGYVWASTNEGLFCLEPSGKLICRISDFPGITRWELGDAGCKLQNGELMFAGNDGFYKFNPVDLVADEKPKPILLSHFSIADSIRYYDLSDIEEVNLAYNENSFSIQFTASDYVFTDFLKYRYKLDGFDEHWNYAEAPILTARYMNIPFGKYIFVVEASDSFGKWTNIRQELPIYIQTPWYYSWWFILMMILLGTGGLYFFIRFREEKLQVEKEKLERLVAERTVELEETNEKLSRSEKELRAMNESKNKFFSIISHDLRNPLNALNITTQSLYEQYDGLGEEDKRNIIRIIYETTGQTHILLENLLLWVVSQMNMLKPSFRQITLSSLLDENIELLRLQAQKKGVSIINQIPEDLLVWVDKDMLSTVFRNLLSNAIHFSYQETEVTVSVSEINGKVEVTVTDKGIGMSEEDQEKLFRLDTKIRTRGTANEQGTGLGLIITREFVHLLGGEIRVESVINQGTTFFFTLNKKIRR